MLIRIHFNKQRAPKGLPWTLHTSKACLPAAHIIVRTEIESEEKPEKKANPRYFFKCRGRIEWDGTTAIIYKENDGYEGYRHGS